MRFNVGYQRNAELVKYISEHAEQIGEIYFPWEGFANGRGRSEEELSEDSFEREAQKRADLKALAGRGIGMNLLLNGNCYGRDAQSRAFFHRIGDTVDRLIGTLGLTSVTTASPLIAKFLHQNFEGQIKVRASVNMEIGEIPAMKYVAEYFDSFYMKREYNRDLRQIKRLTAWCRESGKELHLLANSGCLNFCSARTFHDNLVAHEGEIAAMDNAYSYEGTCRDYLREGGNLESYLCETNFIRPEDLHYYEPYFSEVKLATRVASHPTRILRAYLERRYIGSVMDLLEPNHASCVYPKYPENSRIPTDFLTTVWSCHKQCESCDYCRGVMKNALADLEDAFYGIDK